MKMVTLTSAIIIMPSRDLLTLLHSDIQCLTSLEFWVYYFAEVTLKKKDTVHCPLLLSLGTFRIRILHSRILIPS